MPEVKLKFSGREITPGTGVTALGRTADNDVSFPDDSNVSRFHAEIEARGNEFCLIDLGSSNGTTVNGTKVTGETYLKTGDRILLGGSSEIVFDLASEVKEEDIEAENGSVGSVGMPPIDAAVSQLPGLVSATPAAAAASGSNTMLMVAGGACLLAVIVVVAAGTIYYRSGTSSCDAIAKITKPETGDVIFAATEIEVETENSSCVAKAHFTIDGVVFESTSDAPFTATLDPKEYPDLADGMDHSLGIILEDEDGIKLPQTESVALALETRAVEKPEEKPLIVQGTPQPPIQAGPKGKEVSLIQVQEMSNRLAEQFKTNYRYNVSNKQFLQEVQKKAAEYAQEGYFDRAAKYRDAINVAYVRDQNLNASLGYVLAMSRSKFNPQKQGIGEGLWQMSTEFVTSQSYNGLCGTETLSDPLQNCAAKASAFYMKAMVFGVFDGDVIYSAAAFGKTTQDAGAWKATLPADRTDVWNSIKTAPEREQILRFFAAGIVTENPEKFGLKRDRSIAELYKQAM